MEALTDFNEIMNAADANAKKKLAEEFPEKFKSIMKEELNKNKSAKESYKKIDEVNESDVDKTEEKNESVMKKEVKETAKVGQHSKKTPFEEKPKAKTANMNEENEDELNEERDKEFVKKKHEKDEPNIAKGDKEEKGLKFAKTTSASSGKPMTNKVHEGYDMTDIDIDTVEETIDMADDDDEFLTMEDIEAEIANMENLGEELDATQENDENDPFSAELVNMRNQLDEIIGRLGGIKEQKKLGGRQNFTGREQGGPTTAMIDEKEVAEQKKLGGRQNFTGREQGGPTTAVIYEVDITDDDIDNVLNQDFDNDSMELDETLPHTITHSNARQVGANNHTNYGKEQRLRYAMRESEKRKVHGLINENKKLMRKLSEGKKYKESATFLVENYKNALEKYRNQLKEMAVFNTNLAHVNNLFVNESLALTQEDKIKIINEFKNINSITESQKKYKNFLSEMKTNRRTITETIENKINVSIQPSSKQKHDEVVEKTAYENNEHLKKMKRIIETIERGDRKKII